MMQKEFTQRALVGYLHRNENNIYIQINAYSKTGY